MEIFQEIRQIQCHFHSENSSELLHISGNAVKHRICVSCLQENRVNIEDIVYIREILQSKSSEQILNSFPPLDDYSLFSRLRMAGNFSPENIFKEVQQLKEDVRKKYEDILKEFENQTKSKVAKIEYQRIQILEMYKSMCEKEELKKKIIESEATGDEKDLNEFLKKKCNEIQTNSNQIRIQLVQYEHLNQQVHLNQLINELMNLIKQINFTQKSISILRSFDMVCDNWKAYEIVSLENQGIKINRRFYDKTFDQVRSLISLQKDIKYVFRFLIDQNSGNNDPYFFFSIASSQRHFLVGQEKSRLFYDENNSQYGHINKVIKGQQLQQGKSRNVHKSIELRIHLKSKTLQMLDYPRQENIVEINDQNQIDLELDYHLSLGCYYQGDSITIVSAEIVNEFT